MNGIFSMRLIALLAIGIFAADARNPNKLLVSTDARPGELKYQVALQRDNFTLCGGALISEYHVLTAAHCVVHGYKDLPSPRVDGITIITGSTNPGLGNGENHKAKLITIYPGYVIGSSANRWRHDIAVITLATPVFTNALQEPIPLPTNNIEKSVKAVVSGWGDTTRRRQGDYPDILQKTTVTILNQEECVYRSKIGGTQMCAFDGAATGFCQGDSGGPLVYKNELVGIVSFAVACGFGYPDVYTRVWAYKNFIIDAMKL